MPRAHPGVEAPNALITGELVMNPGTGPAWLSCARWLWSSWANRRLLTRSITPVISAGLVSEARLAAVVAARAPRAFSRSAGGGPPPALLGTPQPQKRFARLGGRPPSPPPPPRH